MCNFFRVSLTSGSANTAKKHLMDPKRGSNDTQQTAHDIPRYNALTGKEHRSFQEDRETANALASIQRDGPFATFWGRSSYPHPGNSIRSVGPISDALLSPFLHDPVPPTSILGDLHLWSNSFSAHVSRVHFCWYVIFMFNFPPPPPPAPSASLPTIFLQE